MDVWKTSLWITALCGIPYLLYFATDSRISWVWVLVLAAFLGFVTMYYVLLKATKLPKKTS